MIIIIIQHDVLPSFISKIILLRFEISWNQQLIGNRQKDRQTDRQPVKTSEKYLYTELLTELSWLVTAKSETLHFSVQWLVGALFSCG